MSEFSQGLAVFLRLNGRQVLVVGGGAVAAAKVLKVQACGAKVVVVAPKLTPELAQSAQASHIEWIPREFGSADVAGCFFVIAATGNPAADGPVFAACEAQSTLCNAADDPAACSAFLLAQRSTGAVTIAAGTGGAAPGLAGRLADEALAGLPADVGALVNAYAQVRQIQLSAFTGDSQNTHARTRGLRRLARQPWPTLRLDVQHLAAGVQAQIEEELERGDDGSDA